MLIKARSGAVIGYRCLHAGLKMEVIKDFAIFDDHSYLDLEDRSKDVDDFIHNSAPILQKHKMAITYGLFQDKAGQDHSPIGFATLQNDAIPIDEEIGNTQAIKIACFGIVEGRRYIGFGSTFLAMIRHFVSHPNNHIGCRFLTLNIRPTIARLNFYDKNSFIVLGGRPAKLNPAKNIIMYLDLERPGMLRPCPVCPKHPPGSESQRSGQSYRVPIIR